MYSYVRCSICYQQVDVSVPTQICPFCGIPAVQQHSTWIKPVAGILIPFSLAAAHSFKRECDSSRVVCFDQRALATDEGHTETRRPPQAPDRPGYEMYVTSTASTGITAALPLNRTS